ncbi:MAG: phosphate/phosphite/phosphonate ABC transporter substrate-binding protein [Candidatus Ozemobacteraceae bacterium]
MWFQDPVTRFSWLTLLLVFLMVAELSVGQDFPTPSPDSDVGESVQATSKEEEADPPPPAYEDQETTLQPPPAPPDEESAPPPPLADEEEEYAPPPPPQDEESAPPTTAPAVPQPPVVLPEKTVVIGRIPYMNLREMMESARVLLGYLKKEMGVKEVRLVTALDYAGVLQTLSRGSVDFAWIGPTAYVMGKEKYKLVPLFKTKRGTDALYHGIFIVRKDSDVQGLDDIKGKTMGFVDRESASGFIYPLCVLQRLKINPFKVCKKVEFLKRHDAVLAAVLNRKIDVGVCLEATLTAVKDAKIRDQILILGKADDVPSDVIVCREDCPTNLREQFVKALEKTAITGAKGTTASGTDQMPTFLPAFDDEFDSVRGVLKSVAPLLKQP